MRTCCWFVLIWSLACSTADVALDGALTRPDLTGRWLEVSEHQGKAVILSPCDGSTRAVQVGGEVLTVSWGQDASEYTVRSARAQGESLELDLLARGTDEPALVSARRTPRGILWKVEDSEIDTVPEKSPLPRMKECCGSTEAEPVPHRTAVIPEAQECP